MNTHFNIANIKENKFQLGEEDIKSLTMDGLKSKLEEHCHLEEVSMENMMEKIVTYTGLDKDTICATSICYEDESYIYQLCHISPEENNKKGEDEHINGVSSYLVYDGKTVYGNGVIMKSKIGDDGICTTSNLTLDDIAKIVYQKLVHKCVKIDVNGNTSEHTYLFDPLECVSDEDKEDYKPLELPLLNHNFIVYIKPNENREDPNKKMTRLAGNGIIDGDVILSSKATDRIFSDVTEEMVEDLDKICWGRFKNRYLSEDEKQAGQKKDGKSIVSNKFTIVKNRLKKVNKECVSCKTQVSSEYFVCSGCYRARYCSKECQLGDWRTHSNECLIKKQSLNQFLYKKLKN